MSDVTDRGKTLLARMEETDSISFYGARIVIRDLIAEVEKLTAKMELGAAMGEAAYNNGN